MKKMLSEHKMMIRPTRVDSDLQAAALRDESLTKDVLNDMSKVMKKNRSEDERVSALLHMEDMLQFMLLREQLREFKQRRQDNLREKCVIRIIFAKKLIM